MPDNAFVLFLVFLPLLLFIGAFVSTAMVRVSIGIIDLFANRGRVLGRQFSTAARPAGGAGLSDPQRAPADSFKLNMPGQPAVSQNATFGHVFKIMLTAGALAVPVNLPIKFLTINQDPLIAAAGSLVSGVASFIITTCCIKKMLPATVGRAVLISLVSHLLVIGVVVLIIAIAFVVT